MTPTMYKKWTVETQTGVEGLVLSKSELPGILGEHEILVKIYAASLNYHDLVMIKVCSLAMSQI